MKRFDLGQAGERSARRALGACLFVIASCSNAGTPARSNVLIVTLDTTRTDALSCYSGPAGVSPTVDAFAARGLLFESAYTPAPLTLPAHSSLLTGRTPDEHGVRSNNAYSLPTEEITLAEILGEAGYDTAAFVGSYVLDAQYGLAQGFAHYGDEIDVANTPASRVAERSARAVTDDALAWLDRRERKTPFFLWVHYYDPHYPHELQPGQSARFAELYHDEVAYCDAQLARLRDKLEAQDLLEDTLVVITADHGEGQLEHGESTHGYFLYQGTQHVPLILSHPRLPQGVRMARSASLIDVVPTVLDFVELEAPTLSGVNLLGESGAERAPIYMEAELPRIDFGLSPLRAAVEGSYKLIDAPSAELYDLERDPNELRNLAGDDTARVQRLRSWLAERRANAKGAAEFRPDAEATEKLLGLGYAGTVDHARVVREQWTPQELAEWANALNAGLRQFQAGDLPAAIRSLETLLETCEASYAGQLYLGMALVQTESIEAGLAHLERAIDLQPLASAEAYWNVAVAHARLGRTQGLEAVLQKALEIDPKHVRARQKLAESLLMAQDPKAAKPHLEALVRFAADTPEGAWAARKLKGLPRSP